MPGPAGPANGGARPKTQLAKPKKAKKPPSQKKPSQQRPLRREIKKVEKQVRVLKKRTNGPKQNDVFTTTVTLGTISGQRDNGLSRQIRLPLNPLLLKSSDGGSTTPLSIRGSMYEMWKLLKAELLATPLTGGANIAGSIGFIVLTLNGLEATADSIDTIKTRKHAQMALGRQARLRLTARECAGPREGWWLTDTSQSPADSYGPAIDLMIAYATTNLLNTSGGTSAPFLGTLWQVEIKVTYAFSTYAPKPGLQTLVSQTLDGSHQVTIQQSTTDGSLIMTTNDANLLSILTPRTGGQRSGKSQTVWAIAATAVEAAAPLLGPWGWLLKGGFWLVRKIFGSTTRDTISQYQIYPSIEAAMSDQPIFGQTGAPATVTLPLVHVSEVMNPNSENNDLSNPTSRSLPPSPPQPSEDPELPLALLTGQPGVPPVYHYGGDEYTPQPKWRGSTMMLTGVPHHKTCIGANSPFGVRVNSMRTVNVTQLDVYDFSDFAIFFGFGEFLGEGPIHTGKTMLYSLFDGGEISRPWLDPTQAQWQLPAWTGFSPPGAGDFYLQMQAVTDKTTRTTSTGCYFLVAYRTSRRLVAFYHAGTSVAPAPESMLCLYNVDAGREPVLDNFNFQLQWDTQSNGLQHCNTVEVDGDPDSDDDISLAGSIVGDEFEGVEQLDRERADLMRRLRDLDLRRFQI
nr:MAG: structural polyprotein [Xinjiang avastrovirus]